MIEEGIDGENTDGGGVSEGIVKLRRAETSIGTGVRAPTDRSLMTVGANEGGGSFLRTKSLRDFSSSSILPMLSFKSLFSPPRRASKLRR